MTVRIPVTHLSRVLDSSTGQTRWRAVAYILNFNDTTPYVRVGDLLDIAESGLPVLTRVTATWNSTSCGVGVRMHILAFSSTARAHYLGGIDSTAYVDDHGQFNCFVPIEDIRELDPNDYLLYCAFSAPGGGHATDDLRMALEFTCYPRTPAETLPAPLPVSLEGYRWPFKRAV